MLIFAGAKLGLFFRPSKLLANYFQWHAVFSWISITFVFNDKDKGYRAACIQIRREQTDGRAVHRGARTRDFRLTSIEVGQSKGEEAILSALFRARHRIWLSAENNHSDLQQRGDSLPVEFDSLWTFQAFDLAFPCRIHHICHTWRANQRAPLRLYRLKYRMARPM